MNKKKVFSDILLEQGLVNREQLEKALDAQNESGKDLNEILLELGFVEEKPLLNAFAQHIDLPFVELSHYDLDIDLSRELSESFARRFKAILLKRDKDSILVGMVDPMDIFAVDELTEIFGRPVKLALISENELYRALDLLYRKTAAINSFANELNVELKGSSKHRAAEILKEADTSVVKLINSMFEDAVQVSASDIHIEPSENLLRIRNRVDGFLQEQIIKEKNVAPALSRLLKLMAGLNIAETRLPQDGRFDIEVHGLALDIRISFLPIQYGESIVMRLLNKSEKILQLKELGMSEETLDRLHKIVTLPHGMLLVTGPTGSGKTTTLYAALQEVNKSDKNIITIEDPIEYRLERANQVQVHSDLGLTFAKVLSSALRQDPDVILVGEIRDQETAAIALRSALTGHMVFSTLHTNDALSAAVRLIDMGVESYLIAATVRGVLAQRLVRRVCSGCVESYTPDLKEIEAVVPDAAKFIKEGTFKRGAGCSYCNNSGYKGRIGVYELLEFDEVMLNSLREGDVLGFANAGAKNNYQSLLTYALNLAKQGKTTLSEALRVIYG